MNVSSLTLVFIPIVITAISCGLNIDEENLNKFIKYVYHLMFSLLAVIVAYLQVFADIPSINIGNFVIDGSQAWLFFVFLFILLMFFLCVSVNRSPSKKVKNLVAIIIFISGLGISVFTVLI